MFLVKMDYQVAKEHAEDRGEAYAVNKAIEKYVRGLSEAKRQERDLTKEYPSIALINTPEYWTIEEGISIDLLYRAIHAREKWPIEWVPKTSF